MSNIYNPGELKEEAILKKLILDTAVDVQSVLQLMIKKEMITKEELDSARDYVRNIPKYKASYEAINELFKAGDVYERDPQAYLRAIVKAKMDGTIK